LTTFPNYSRTATLVRVASLRTAKSDDWVTLAGLGLAEETEEGFELSEAGRAFDDVANVYRQTADGMEILRHAYLGVPAVQVLMQGLHGRGPVPADGAHYMVARHGLFDPRDREGFGSLLKTLNELGIVAYAKRQATVRLAVPIADEESVEPVVVRLVQRDTPYTNRRHLRETLREAEDYLWWADPHFDKSALEPLSDEADPTRVSAIRILTGSMPSPAEMASHYRPFIEEMANRGITVEIRVVPGPDRDWHDRFIVTKSAVWNTPPTKMVTKGDYSEFTKTDNRPPFDEWWSKANPIS
jgi:hypothetical protein